MIGGTVTLSTEELAAVIRDAIREAIAEAEPWLDKQGLADHFACSVRTVEYWQAEGLPFTVIAGRVKFKRAGAEDWLREHDHLRDGSSPTTVAVTSSTNGAATGDTAPPRDQEA